MRAAATVAALFLTLLAAGCSTVESRIKQNPTVYRSLPPPERELVAQGRIAEGMSRDAVYLAWGRPGEVAYGSVDGRKFEEWRYFLYEQDFVYGGGFAAVPVRTRSGVYFVPYFPEPTSVTQRRLYRRAVFGKDEVVSWETIAGL